MRVHIPTVSLDVISLVASSCGYNRGEIEPRVAHEFTAHVATQRGRAERPHHRHPPRAGTPRWPPRGGATPTRCTGLVRRGPPPSPLVAAWPWPCHPWRLVRSSCWDSRRRKSQRGRQEGEERCRYRERMFHLVFAPLLSADPPALLSPVHHSAAASRHRARVARPAAHGTPDTPPYRWPAAAPLRPKCRNRPYHLKNRGLKAHALER